MSDFCNVSRGFLTECISIRLFLQFPCLWHVKTKEYSDRKKKAAYETLITKMKEVEQNATKDTVGIRKINTIRGCVRKEYKKVQSSLKSGLLVFQALCFFNIKHATVINIRCFRDFILRITLRVVCVENDR
nr:unnamed protein product [Callosobruchus analis]